MHIESFNPTILVNVLECFATAAKQVWLTNSSILSNWSTHNPTALNGGKATPAWISSGRTRQTLPSIPSPPITKTLGQGRARPCGWAVVHMHANDACARPQEQAHALTQVLSGLTLNKWSIHLGSQNVPSINSCRLISCSSIAAGSKKELRLLKVTKSWSTTVPGWIKFTATCDWTS